MTGKDLILFIANHNLFDVELNKNTIKDLFLTIDEAAIKMKISTTSLLDMIRIGIIDYIEINDKIYLHKDVTLMQLKRR